MSYLLDTNVLSELRKPLSSSNAHVREWIASFAPTELFLSAITVLEIEVGIQRLQRRDAAQAQLIRAWLENQVLVGFAQRILPIDVAVLRLAAQMHVPDPRPERDVLIAATAGVNGLVVATRKLKDFEPLGIPLVNPWEQKPG